MTKYVSTLCCDALYFPQALYVFSVIFLHSLRYSAIRKAYELNSKFNKMKNVLRNFFRTKNLQINSSFHPWIFVVFREAKNSSVKNISQCMLLSLFSWLKHSAKLKAFVGFMFVAILRNTQRSIFLKRSCLKLYRGRVLL